MTDKEVGELWHDLQLDKDSDPRGEQFREIILKLIRKLVVERAYVLALVVANKSIPLDIYTLRALESRRRNTTMMKFIHQKLKCRFCKHLASTFKALREHCKDKHPLEYSKVRLGLRDEDDKLRLLVEYDIVE